MDLELAGVAERLAVEFADLPSIVVIDAVCTCAGECANAGPLFVEQGARARLVAWCAEPPPTATFPMTADSPVGATAIATMPLQPSAADVADAIVRR